MIGKIIGNYEITAELARGGMGAVYRGRHIRLPREVVVKAILLSSFPQQAQEQLKARFLREAYIQSQLDHPNIVRVYEFFISEENYYLVMEFVDGMSLSELVKSRGALDPVHAIPLFKQALTALDHAHNFKYVDESGSQNSGIVHRDIKSANMLLDGMARLKITDFGIVKLSGERGMTRTGFNPGTAEYMSPEQIRGLEVDARSDLYSLGVTLYEALTGRLPFPHSKTGSEYEVLRGHIELMPPPLTTIQPNIPASLSGLVMRSLEKQPDARFQSAGEFLEALLDYERGPASLENVVEKTEPKRPQTLIDLMTEPLPRPQPAVPAAPAAPVTTVTPAATGTPVLPDLKTSDQNFSTNLSPTPEPAQPQQRRYGRYILLSVCLLTLALAVAGYFVWRQYRSQEDEASMGSTMISASPPAVITATPIVLQEDARLKQAREHEQQELYTEAIKLYDEYIKANPQTTDLSKLSAQVGELKKMQGLLSTAEFAMSRKDFKAARQDFAAALEIRPDSKRAQHGLAKAESLLAQSPDSPASGERKQEAGGRRQE
jgi:eukaryotic-like serine/threonine-protein kinase